MFNKLKEKAGQPLTHGGLWKCYIVEIIVAGIVYGGMYVYGSYLEKKANEACKTDTEMNYDEFENEED